MAENDPSKSAEQLEKRSNELRKLREKLTTTETERDDKVAKLENQLVRVEAEKKALADEKGKVENKVNKFEKRMAGNKTAKVASDLLGSSAAQVVNLGEQALLDYLTATFDTLGSHKAMVKGIPVALSLLYYAFEIATLKEKPTLGKNIRMTLANVLQNLNFVYLAQTIRQEYAEKRSDNAKMGQTVEELQAGHDHLQKDLERAKKLLADRGVKFESGNE